MKPILFLLLLLPAFVHGKTVRDKANKCVGWVPSPISISPDPAKTMITLRCPYKIEQLVIMNVFGQIVYSQFYDPTNTVQVNCEAFPRGMYFVKINGKEVRKFAKW